LDAFDTNIQSIRQPKDIPDSLQGFINYVQDYCDIKVVGIGVGPDRDQYVDLR
jgi:adenylosuccinate synthase